MLKRMTLMLAVMFAIIAVLGFVKFRQVQVAMAQGAAFQPPPEAVTTIVAELQDWPATHECHRHDGGGAGRDRQRRSAGRRRSHYIRVGPGGGAGRGARRARHAAGARATGRNRGPARTGRAQLHPHEGPAERSRDLAGGVRPGDGRAEADRRPGRRDPRHHRAQDDPGAVLGNSRHPAGQPRAVPRSRRSARRAPVAAPHLRELRGAAAGHRTHPDRPSGPHRRHRSRRRGLLGARDGDRLDRRSGDQKHPGAGHAGQSRRQAATRHVRADRAARWGRSAASSRCRRRPSAMRRSATPCSS